MAKRIEFGEVNLDVRAGSERASQVEESDSPFRILILGDFSGEVRRRSTRAGAAPAAWRPKLVDRDNFDDVLRKAGAAISIPLGEDPTELHFDSLDDFHPDSLFERAPLFQKLRELRSRVSDGSISQGELETARGAAEPKRTSPDVSRMASRNLLEDAINATEGQEPRTAPGPPDELASFVRRAVEPHLVAKPDPRQAESLGLIDQAASAQMRALLRLPDFRALEAAWRTVFFLVRRIETDAALKVYLLDISKAELSGELGRATDLRGTPLYRLLVEEARGTPGGEPWTVLAGNYTFRKTLDDLVILRLLAKLAAAAGAPLIAGASPGLAACASAADLCELGDASVSGSLEGSESSVEDRAWEALRNLPEASYVGLALPRFLLRLPYGRETDAVERFPFEEITGEPSHDDYLWGNSAFLCASILAAAFAGEGWAMRPGQFLDVGGLPLHTYRQDGEAVATPCAESLLTLDAAEQILDAGLIPVAALANRDAARVVRLQSIARPLRPLSGRWA